ncbi:MAG: SGNH/GDSL hydrolase family protein [Mobilicoccus sp.]|nr:SGNH/GDSL hydrolase family protein [Mobilicoccus sp.]
MSTYVALGDSFAAGIGSRTPGGRCRRDGGYPMTVAAALGVDLAYQACQSTTVIDVLADQVEALTPSTELVTLTVGGNDAGFADVVLAAAKPRLLVDGVRVIDEARRRTVRVLPRLLLALLDEIAERAPDARVVVTGYPQLFGARDCRWYTFFDADELAALSHGTDALVQLILDVASRRDTTLVDVRPWFGDRHACGTEPWIHHLTWPLQDSFHPTSAGHDAIAAAVLHALGQRTDHRSLTAAPPEVRPGPCLNECEIDVPTLLTAGLHG